MTVVLYYWNWYILYYKSGEWLCIENKYAFEYICNEKYYTVIYVHHFKIINDIIKLENNNIIK